MHSVWFESVEKLKRLQVLSLDVLSDRYYLQIANIIFVEKYNMIQRIQEWAKNFCRLSIFPAAEIN